MEKEYSLNRISVKEQSQIKKYLPESSDGISSVLLTPGGKGRQYNNDIQKVLKQYNRTNTGLGNVIQNTVKKVVEKEVQPLQTRRNTTIKNDNIELKIEVNQQFKSQQKKVNTQTDTNKSDLQHVHKNNQSINENSGKILPSSYNYYDSLTSNNNELNKSAILKDTQNRKININTDLLSLNQINSPGLYNYSPINMKNKFNASNIKIQTNTPQNLNNQLLQSILSLQKYKDQIIQRKYIQPQKEKADNLQTRKQIKVLNSLDTPSIKIQNKDNLDNDQNKVISNRLTFGEINKQQKQNQPHKNQIKHEIKQKKNEKHGIDLIYPLTDSNQYQSATTKSDLNQELFSILNTPNIEAKYNLQRTNNSHLVQKFNQTQPFNSNTSFLPQIIQNSSINKTLESVNINAVNFQDQKEDGGSDGKKKTQKGFGIANKTFQTMVIIDQPLIVAGELDITNESVYGKKEMKKNYSLLKSKIKKEKLQDIIQSNNISIQNEQQNEIKKGFEKIIQLNLNSYLTSKDYNKMSQKIQNSKLEIIQKRLQEQQEKIQSPTEFLSRHPKDIKMHRHLCREIRNKEKKGNKDLMPMLAQYQVVTPTELSSMGISHDTQNSSQMNFKSNLQLKQLQLQQRSNIHLQSDKIGSLHSIQKQNSNQIGNQRLHEDSSLITKDKIQSDEYFKQDQEPKESDISTNGLNVDNQEFHAQFQKKIYLNSNSSKLQETQSQNSQINRENQQQQSLFNIQEQNELGIITKKYENQSNSSGQKIGDERRKYHSNLNVKTNQFWKNLDSKTQSPLIIENNLQDQIQQNIVNPHVIKNIFSYSDVKDLIDKNIKILKKPQNQAQTKIQNSNKLNPKNQLDVQKPQNIIQNSDNQNNDQNIQIFDSNLNSRNQIQENVIKRQNKELIKTDKIFGTVQKRQEQIYQTSSAFSGSQNQNIQQQDKQKNHDQVYMTLHNGIPFKFDLDIEKSIYRKKGEFPPNLNKIQNKEKQIQIGPFQSIQTKKNKVINRFASYSPRLKENGINKQEAKQIQNENKVYQIIQEESRTFMNSKDSYSSSIGLLQSPSQAKEVKHKKNKRSNRGSKRKLSLINSISSKLILVNNKSDEIDYLDLFLREEIEQRNKYIINQSNLEVIDMIDQILLQKQSVNKKFSSKRSVINVLQSPKSSLRNNSVGQQSIESMTPFNMDSTGNKHQLQAQLESLTPRINLRPVQPVSTINSSQESKKKILPIVAEVLKDEAIMQKERMQQKRNNSMKNQIKIIQGNQQKVNKTNQKQCSCGVRDLIKQMIRKIRNMENSEQMLQQMKNQLVARLNGQDDQQQEVLKICAHDFEQNIKEEQQLIFLSWFDKFQEQVFLNIDEGLQQDPELNDNKMFKSERKKPIIFRRFIKFILSEEDTFNPMIQQLQNYIIDNNLMHGTIEYSDFYRYNKFMAIMKKKKQKLQQDDIPKLDLEESEDSSISENSSIQNDMKMTQVMDNINLFEPSSNFLPSNVFTENNSPITSPNSPRKNINLQDFQFVMQEQVQNQEQTPKILLPQKKQKIPVLQLYKSDRITGQNLNRQMNENNQNIFDITVSNEFQLTISEKMYRNFLLKMTNNLNGDLNQLNETLENQSQGNDEVFINISQKKLEKSINESLKFVIKQLKELKTLKDAREQQLIKRQQQIDSNRLKPEEPKYTDPLLLKLKNKLENNLEESLNNYEKLYQQKYKRRDNSQQQDPSSPSNLQRGLSLNNQSIQDLINSKSKDKKQKKTGNDQTMKLYNNDLQKQIFFQQAKIINDHPDDGFKDKNAVLVKYYKECKKNMILPQPHFLRFFKNRVLAIQGEPISIEICQALKEIIIESNERQIQDMQIQQLIIDDASINDEKLKVILEALNKQNDLKKIALMNSTIGKQSSALLIESLQKKSPNEVQELKLVNIKGIEMADHFDIKLLKQGQPSSYIDQILTEIIEQNQIIQLQLSNLVLNDNKVVQKLNNIIMNNNQLLELDLSFSKFSIYQFQSIIESLGKYQNTIQQLSLRGINILKLPTIIDTNEELPESIYEKKELVDQIVKDLCKYIKESFCLYHIDISQMSLGNYLLEIAENSLCCSDSLLSIHLSSNDLNFLQIKDLLEYFNIDIADAFPQIWSSLGIIDLKGPNSNPSFLQDELINSALISNQENFSPSKMPKSSDFRIKPTTNDQSSIQSQIKKLIMGDFLKNYKHQEKLMKSIKNVGEKRIADIDIPDHIVIQRKNGFPESLHNEKIKNVLFQKYKELDFGNLKFQWQLRLDNDECYYCNNYNYYKIFYRRSLAHDQFQRIIDAQEIKKLKLQLSKYDVFKDPHDPTKSNPLIFGSILDKDIPYARLVNVKEQAIYIWALQEINKIKDKNDEKKYKDLKQTLKQIEIVMNYGVDSLQKLEEQKNQIKDNIQEIKVIFQYFANWRQFIFPGDEYEKLTKSQYQILNFPIFQENNPKEDDIYIFNGFIRPDIHKIYIYDPLYDAFFKKENIIVNNRPKGMKLQKDEFKIEHGDLVRAIPTEIIDDQLSKTEMYLLQMKGENQQNFSSFIFGDLKIDFSFKFCNSAFENDFDIKLFKFSQFIKSKDQEIEQIMQIMRENYNVIIGIWRYYEQKILINQFKEIENLKKVQDENSDLYNQTIQINLNNFISLLKSLFRNTQIYKEIKNINPLLQKTLEGQKQSKQFNIFRLIVQEVYDTIAYCYTGEKYQYSNVDPSKIQATEPLKKQLTSQLQGKQEIQNYKPMLQRRMLPLCLIRLSHYLSAHIYGLQADKVFFRAINYCSRFLKLPANGQETVQKNLILFNDIGYLKNQYIFKNKALCVFLKLNKKGIFDHLYQKLLKQTYQNQMIGFHQGGKNMPSNQVFTINRNDACNTHSSLDNLLELINKIQTKYKRKNGEDVLLVLPSINVCKRLALESKINLVAQDIESEIHNNSLKFEEFLIFITLISVYMQNSQIRERFEPLEKQESEDEATIQSNIKKEDQSSIKNPFLLGCLAIENTNQYKGKKIFKRMKINIALNLQDFITQLNLSKAFESDQDEENFKIQEMDSSIFAYEQTAIVQEEQVTDPKAKK